MIRNRLHAFFHPSLHGGLTWGKYVLLSLLLSAMLLVRDGAPAQIASVLGLGVSDYGPTAAQLHLTGVRYVVHSQFWWDASSCQCTPVDDKDFVFAAGVQERTLLPGGPWVHYRWLTAGYIPGSGFYTAWLTPNGGKLAFFHQQWTSFNASHGGDQVGLSQWPTDPYYGNGLAGAANAHLCIAYDAAAQWWFEVGLHHPPPAKPHFPLARWNVTVWSYNQHHRGHIHAYVSPYYRKALSRIAADWWRGGLSKRFAGPGKKEAFDSRNKVIREDFPGKRVVYEWSTIRRAPLKWVRAGRTIRVNR